MRRKLPIHIPKRITRKGVRISPKLHLARLLAYMILIPLLTWYGHQKYTNPFMFHPNIQLRGVGSGQIISFYETNFRDTVNQFDLYLDEIEIVDSGAVNIQLSKEGFFNYKDSIMQETLRHPNLSGVITHASIILNYHHWNIVIALNNSPLLLRKECDILIVPRESRADLYKLREKYAPRLTILYDSSDNNAPSNIYFQNSREILNISEGRFRRLHIEKFSL